MNKAARLISPEDQARARRVEARHAWLMEHDPQYRAAASLEAITLAKKDPGTRMGQLIAVAMEAYADRPALGRRATTIGTDPATGRRSQVLLDEFETVSFRDVWADVRGLANLRQHDESVRVRPGEFVCILGFAGAGYVIVDLAATHVGAVSVPLQTNARTPQLAAIDMEARNMIRARLTADAKEATAAFPEKRKPSFKGT